ncbi:hypothetical protein [Paraburkholderia terricola]|uniref:hypothetical protein n=1 Tax=Paraburkholderia terricola TaxID=169427 RepID=UPI000DF01BE6|nr:hypothetical protein [Paraburkholderia terricola]AXE96112.1 hypothetical protein CUJ90_28220 [Paraburkholderia terricola]
MATSIHQQSADLLRLVEATGMRADLETKLEAQNLQERKRLVAEIMGKRAEFERVSPGLDRAFREAWENLELAEAKLRAAKQVFNHVAQQSHGAQCQAGTCQEEARLEKIAPRFIRDAIDSVEEMTDFLRGIVRGETRQITEWTFAGRVSRTIDISNLELVRSIRMTCEAALDEMHAMMLDTHTPLAEQRKRCEALVAGCKASAMPHLKDDPNFLRHQDSKHARAAKSA